MAEDDGRTAFFHCCGNVRQQDGFTATKSGREKKRMKGRKKIIRFENGQLASGYVDKSGVKFAISQLILAMLNIHTCYTRKGRRTNDYVVLIYN